MGVHEIVPLRADVRLPADYQATGDEWVTLAEAEAAGVDLRGRDYSIGPLRPGVVYRSRYWGTVSTVHQVFVRTSGPRSRDRRTGRYTRKQAHSYLVCEEHQGEERPRFHCTPWEYGRGTVLGTLTGAPAAPADAPAVPGRRIPRVTGAWEWMRITAERQLAADRAWAYRY